MLHVLGPFRREGGIRRDFLASTQQLVLGSLAFMVVFLHWLTKPTKATTGIGLANGKAPSTRLPQPRKAVGVFPHPTATTSIVVFQKRASLNVRSRLHYSSGGVRSIRQRRAAAGHQRTQGGLSATGRSMRHRWPSRRGSESARIDLRCPTSH